jgi:hypothetical protein
VRGGGKRERVRETEGESERARERECALEDDRLSGYPPVLKEGGGEREREREKERER